LPRKIRELKSDLRRAGFEFDHQTGSHEVWSHPTAPELRVTIAGHDGDDAKPYQEKQVRTALERLRAAGKDGAG
jgi:predicted RNA binding protein YcfA (HicA-like mRNA interferase family)